MAKKTKRVEKFKHMANELEFPNLPNPGTVGKDGRILRVRADFKSVNDMIESLMEYHMAYGQLRKKLWPTIKKHHDYKDLSNYPKEVSLTFEKAYKIGAGYIELVHESLGRMTGSTQFPNFTSYVEFLEGAINGGGEYSREDFKVFSKLEKMNNEYGCDLGAFFELLVHWQKQINLRDTLLNWVLKAKKTPAYTGKEERPARTRPTSTVLGKPNSHKKQKVPPQKQGRPQKRTDEELKLRQKAYEEYYRVYHDYKLAWHKVAETFGDKSWNAVRVACMRLKKKLKEKLQ